MKFMKYTGYRDESAFLYPGRFYLVIQWGGIFRSEVWQARCTVIASDGDRSYPLKTDMV